MTLNNGSRSAAADDGAVQSWLESFDRAQMVLGAEGSSFTSPVDAQN